MGCLTSWDYVPHLFILRCNMSSNLILLVGLIYLYVAIEQGIKGNIGMLIAFAGYAFSNVGLYLLSSK